MKILVTGDRNWTDKKAILNALLLFPKCSTLIHGGCCGADFLASRVAQNLGIPTMEFTADWSTYGKSAGPIRNRKMLDMKPDLVIAFHDNLAQSKGTKDCFNEAKRRGIKTFLVNH